MLKTCHKKLFDNVSASFSLSVYDHPNSKIAHFLPLLERKKHSEARDENVYVWKTTTYKGFEP